MTREEQIRHKAGDLADFAIAHGAPWEEYHNGFIDGAKWADEHPVRPSLPSNLDEAAEDYEAGIHFSLSAAFISGAKWMAGQGVTSEGEILDVSGRPLADRVIRTVSIKDMEQCLKDFNKGDKVVVQIRKK